MKRFRISASLIVLVLIFILGTATRFIGLGNNPAGIIDDEADVAYDAYSLIRTGRDQWGISWPLTSFRGFGDYRLPAYTYIAIPSVAAFGLTPFAIRFPSALFGSLTIVAVYLLIKELFRDQKGDVLSLLAAFFLAISPWHIGMSRIGLEETASVFFVTCGLLAFLRGRSRGYWIVLGGVLFGLSLYIYTANILLGPFLLAFAWWCFRKDYQKFRKQLFIGLACFALVAAPIVIFLGVSTAATRTRQVNLTNDPGVIDVVNEKQGTCSLTLPRFVCRIVFNKYMAFGTKFISNYINHFSPNLLSIYGTNTQFSILPGRGLLYLLEYPLLFLALVYVFAHPTSAGWFLVGFLLFSAVPDSLTSDGQYARFFISYPVWPILSALGTVTLLSFVRKRKALSAAFMVVCFMAFAGFTVEYWTYFPHQYSRYSHFGYEELISDVQKNIPAYDRIIISSRVNDAKQYIYYLFYTAYDPALFQSGFGIQKVVESNGWVRVQKVNTVYFLPALPGEAGSGRELLIGAPSEFPKTIPNVIPAAPVPIEFEIKDKAGHILFEGVDSAKLYSVTSIAK